ncbi:MAG: hypothetical protein ABIP64_06240 [Burkholderiales bacterium]
MASPACSICQRPDHPDIDAALAAGSTIMATAAHHGASKSALGRHKLNCLAPKLAAAAKMVQPIQQSREPVERAKAIVRGTQPMATDLLSVGGLLGRLARSLERLEGAADSAAADNLHASLAVVSGQIHRGIETAGKLQGLYDEPEVRRQPSFSITINLPNPAETSVPSPKTWAEGNNRENLILAPEPVTMRLDFNQGVI